MATKRMGSRDQVMVGALLVIIFSVGLLAWLNQMSLSNTIPRGQLKGAIIQYATAYVQKNGYKDLNLDTVSRDLNVSHGAPYRHFKTKTDLLASLALDGFNDLADTQTEFLSRHPEGSREQLIALSEAYVDFLVRRERLYDVMWDFTWTPDINPETAAAGRRTFLIHVGAIKSYIDAQGLDPELQDEMAMNVWAFLHGLAVLALHKEAIVKPTPERLNMLVRSGMYAMLDGYDLRKRKQFH